MARLRLLRVDPGTEDQWIPGPQKTSFGRSHHSCRELIYQDLKYGKLKFKSIGKIDINKIINRNFTGHFNFLTSVREEHSRRHDWLVLYLYCIIRDYGNISLDCIYPFLYSPSYINVGLSPMRKVTFQP